MTTKIFFRSLMMAAVLGLCGCEQFQEAWEEATTQKESSWGQSYEPKYVMGMFQIVKYPRAKDLESEITTFTGEKIWINTNQFFSSKNVKEIKLIPRADRPDAFDLSVRLDDRGMRLWTVMAQEFRGREVVLMIDGVYQCRFEPLPLKSDEDEWAVIRYPFDEVTANALVKYAKKNYGHFNPSPSRLF